MVKNSKIKVRVVIIVLGLILCAGIILDPVVSTSGQFLQQFQIQQYFPLVMKDAAPTETPTPSATFTATATQPTATLSPTPTATGTLTTGPTLKVVVTPSEAKVNESFTFTIEVGNTGTGPTRNNLVSDSFPTYIDVVTVTTTRGSVTKLTHSFVITVGDVLPNEKITISAVVRVNSTLSRTETQANLVTMTYDVSRSITASVNYKVVLQTLPPTGELPLNWRETRINPISLMPWLLLMVLGFVLLFFGIWSRVRNKTNTVWMIAAGALIFLIGSAIGMTALGVFKSDQQLYQNPITPTTGGILSQLQPLEGSATSLPHLPAAAFSTPEAVVPMATLPDYPVPSPEITVTPQPGELGPDISAVVRIAIPALSLDTEVKYVPYDGITWLIFGLRQEVAWMGDTSWPGLGGNTALAGHVTVAGIGDGPFRHLDSLTPGETVILYTERNIYTYNVRESLVTDDGDMSVLLPSENPQITLITCVNWDQDVRTYMNRLVVFADLVRADPIVMASLP